MECTDDNSPHPVSYLGIYSEIRANFNHCFLLHGSPQSEWVPGVDAFPTKPVPWFFLFNSMLIVLHRSSIDNFPINFRSPNCRKTM